MHDRTLAVAVARDTYQRFICDTGFRPPKTYAEMLLFVELSGCPVRFCADAPTGFDGIQIGDWVHVSGSGRLSDRQRMRILAHEWVHWLRRRVGEPGRIRLYQYRGRGVHDRRDYEEEIARAFERLF